MKVRKFHNLYLCRKRRHRSVTSIYRFWETKIPSTVRDSATSSGSLAHPKPPEIRRNDAASTDTHDTHSLQFSNMYHFFASVDIPLLYRMLYLSFFCLQRQIYVRSSIPVCFELLCHTTSAFISYSLFCFVFEYWTCIHIQDY